MLLLEKERERTANQSLGDSVNFVRGGDQAPGVQNTYDNNLAPTMQLMQDRSVSGSSALRVHAQCVSGGVSGPFFFSWVIAETNT